MSYLLFFAGFFFGSGLTLALIFWLAVKDDIGKKDKKE